MNRVLFYLSLTTILVLSHPVIAADIVDVVKNFGCPQDGTRDAAKVINRAIREASGKTIRIPKGTIFSKNRLCRRLVRNWFSTPKRRCDEVSTAATAPRLVH